MNVYALPVASGQRAQLIEGVNKFQRIQVTPGAFYYLRRYGRDHVAGLVFSCPCGCGRVERVPFSYDLGYSRVWGIVGDGPSPNVYPRLVVRDREDVHWSGWLRNGMWCRTSRG